MLSKHVCDKCNYYCHDISNWKKHISTSKHLGTKKSKINVLECIVCNYSCNSQSLFDKHRLTNKHKKNVLDINPHTIDYASIITKLLTQNSELKDFIVGQANEHKKETTEIINKVLDQVKPGVVNTINHHNNQAFNINMYLNEQCKDAINFSDFINNIEVSREDLENNAELGFVGGISKIFIDHLRLLNKSERPIHCTDAKRDIMYIKDDNKWNKEDSDAKLRSAIQAMTRKSVGTLLSWKKDNVDYRDSDSAFSQRCIVIQQHSMAAHNRDEYYSKVIHALAKEVMIEKS